MTFPVRNPRTILAALGAAFILLIVFACNVTDGNGNTYMTVQNDSAWSKFDTLEISWQDPISGEGGLLFRGKPSDLKQSNKFPADGYKGQKVKIVFKGYIDKTLAYEEHRSFDGSNPAIVVKDIIPIKPPLIDSPAVVIDSPKVAVTKTKAPKLTTILADTLVSIHDSVAFSASASVDSGSLKAYAWDYDGDGKDSAVISGLSATLHGGRRFHLPGAYQTILRVYSSSDSMASVKTRVIVSRDEPIPDAGRDQTVYSGATVKVIGIAEDLLGAIVRREWKIGTAQFAETASGILEFKAPEAPATLACVFRVTDDDTQSVADTMVIHVVSPTESNLTDIAVSVGKLSPQFDPGRMEYVDTVAYDVESVTVTPVGNGAIAVNDAPLESGRTSGPIHLKVGANPIDLTVRLSGSAGKTYRLNVVRMPASVDAGLSGITVSAGDLDTPFNPDDTIYTVSVPNATASATVKAGLRSAASTMTINGFRINSGATTEPISLSVGANVVSIIVTAQDGGKRTYSVTLIRAGNDNVALSGLSLSAGSIQPLFNAAVLGYSLAVGTEVTGTNVTAHSAHPASTLTLNDQPILSGVPVSVNLGVGANPIIVVVTAQNGSKNSYTVQVTRAGNGNADLSSISLSAGDIVPPFDPGTVFYSLAVANGVTSTSASATVTKASSSLTLNGSPAESGKGVPAALQVGPNTITFEVTAQTGDKKSYTVLVTRAPNANADLQGLELSAGVLNPAFGPGITDYTASVGNQIESATIAPTVSSGTASVTVGGLAVLSGTASKPVNLKVGENPTDVVVTAQSGATKKYTVNFIRAPNGNADLSGLAISNGALDPAFASGTTAYAVTVANSVKSITLTPSVSMDSSTVTVASKPVPSGTVSGPIVLATGITPITVEVTAQNGTTKSYSILVTREESANADLGALTVSSGTLDPEFAPGTTLYSVSLPNSVVSFTLSPTAADAASTVTIAPNATVNLVAGLNTFTVNVTAQDKTKKTYTVHATRAKNGDADLSGLSLSGNPPDFSFLKSITEYTVNVANGVTTMTLTPTVSAGTSKVTVNGIAAVSGTASGPHNLAVGSNSLPVAVTAENGTVKTYLINVVRANDSPIVSGLKDTTFSINDVVGFKLTATDPQGISRFMWDFNGDGLNEDTTATGTRSRAFPGTPQVAKVIVSVQDNQGAVTKVSANFTIVLDPPVVSAGKDTGVATGRTIRVRGSASDAYGRIVLLEWSFGGGAFIKASTPDTNIAAPSVQNLNYPIVLRATDDDGNVVQATSYVKVEKIALVSVGYVGSIVTSPDGITWTNRSPGTTTKHLLSVVWTGTQFVTVGSGSTILTSPDGITWTSRVSNISGFLNGVAWTGNKLVAVGDGGIVVTSPDGVEWTPGNSGNSTGWKAITWTGNLLVAVGSGSSNACIMTSPDGITWTIRDSKTAIFLYGVAWTGSQLTTVGYGGVILTSPDGITWTPRTSGTTLRLEGVVWTGTQFAAAGQAGIVLTSPDGITWTQRGPVTSEELYSLAWTGSLFVVVGDGGPIYTSPDAITWTSRDSKTPYGLSSIVLQP
jgi:hypothetical protein